MYSVRFNVEDKFSGIKNLLYRLFKVVPPDQDVCIRATYIRRSYKLPEVDSLILATAVQGGYTHFYTFDDDFEELDGKRIENTVIHYLT